MANWVQCSRYDEERTAIWINLDQVVAVREHDNGSTLICAVRESGAALEIPVWDRPLDILFRKPGSDG